MTGTGSLSQDGSEAGSNPKPRERGGPTCKLALAANNVVPARENYPPSIPISANNEYSTIR
jgi:hypothetical protein